MIRIFLLVILIFAFQVKSKETLDVVVLYYKSTINNVPELNSTYKRNEKSKEFIRSLKQSFNNSELGSHYDFRLKASILKDFVNITNKVNPSPTDLSNIYSSYIRLSVQNGNKPFGTLQNIQKTYNADIVLSVFPHTLGVLNTGVCGASPTPMKNNFFLNNVSELLKIGPYGIIFINADSYCMKKDYLIAHEVGHGFGLKHGLTIDGEVSFNSYKDEMIDYASGIGYNDKNSLLYRGTIMAQPGSISDTIHDRFSDISVDKCGVWKNKPCGNVYSSAI